MLSRQFIRADLNLLVALQALLEERSVTRAAEQLFITQPALSKKLKKLQDLFNDELFSRLPYGLLPTPKALELEKQLPNILRQLNQLIGGTEFVPAEYSGVFRIAMPESLSVWLVPRLLAKLAKIAPGVTLRIEDPSAQFIDELTNGRVDFAFHVVKDYPGAIHVESLGGLESRCIMRSDHPLAQKKLLTQKDFLSYTHVRLYVAKLTKLDIGLIDERLAETGQKRRVILETPHLTACLDTLKVTDALLVASGHVAAYSLSGGFVSKPIPDSLENPDLEVGIFYHRRVTEHAPHQWLKALMLELMSSD
jgi:DNA-binding transcriptional LysR family regulator